jgi:predicted nucleic acid-binding protein
MIRTYVDAGILIATVRGDAESAKRALEVLDDPKREFASSVFLKLEVLPKAVWYRNTVEVQSYETFFASVEHWAEVSEDLAVEAYQIAAAAGLAALDALHVAAAIAVGAEELVTTEGAEKPIHRVQGIAVVSIHPAFVK